MARRARLRYRPRRQRETLRPASPTAKPVNLLADQPPQPQVLPIDPIHTGQIGAINLNYGNTLANVAYDQGQIGQTYGYNPAGGIDPTNPFSVAANLQRRFQQAQRGTTNSFAAGGQLYSGAHQRNLDEGVYQYKRSEDEAKRAAQNAYHGLDVRRQEAEFNRSLDISAANSDRLMRLDPEQTVPQTPLTTIPRQGVNTRQAQRVYRRRRRR